MAWTVRRAGSLWHLVLGWGTCAAEGHWQHDCRVHPSPASSDANSHHHPASCQQAVGHQCLLEDLEDLCFAVGCSYVQGAEPWQLLPHSNAEAAASR